MKEPSDSVERSLFELREKTARIGARPAFAAQVMSAVGRESMVSWPVGIVRLARYGLLAAAAMAVLGVGAAYEYTQVNDEEQILAYGAVELFE
jgi:hypothetical protein